MKTIKLNYNIPERKKILANNKAIVEELSRYNNVMGEKLIQTNMTLNEDLVVCKDLENAFNDIEYSLGNKQIEGYITDRVKMAQHGVWIITKKSTNTKYYLNYNTMTLTKSVIKSRIGCVKYYWKTLYNSYLKYMLPILLCLYGLINSDATQHIHILSLKQWNDIKDMLNITMYVLAFTVACSFFSVRQNIISSNLSNLYSRVEMLFTEEEEDVENDSEE